MSTGSRRKVDRTVILAVILIVVGAALWLWPRSDTTEVEPELATVSASVSPGTTSSTATSSSSSRAATRPSTVATRTTSAAVATRQDPARQTSSVASSAGSTERPTTTAVKTTTTPVQDPPAAPGVPALITVPFSSESHPDGVRITVIPHGPTADGAMWIPGPEEGIDDWSNSVSWLNSPGFASPFSTHGAVIIAGHINWRGTPGALSDLSEYGADDIGKTITVTMTDGRVRTYRITDGYSIEKAELAAEGNQGPLHTKMFGQIQAYGSAGHPTEELRLISCGGEYDADAHSYNSNIVVVAQPVDSA